jgi:hypothetical protein
MRAEYHSRLALLPTTKCVTHTCTAQLYTTAIHTRLCTHTHHCSHCCCRKQETCTDSSGAFQSMNAHAALLHDAIMACTGTQLNLLIPAKPGKHGCLDRSHARKSQASLLTVITGHTRTRTHPHSEDQKPLMTRILTNTSSTLQQHKLPRLLQAPMACVAAQHSSFCCWAYASAQGYPAPPQHLHLLRPHPLLQPQS